MYAVTIPRIQALKLLFLLAQYVSGTFFLNYPHPLVLPTSAYPPLLSHTKKKEENRQSRTFTFKRVSSPSAPPTPHVLEILIGIRSCLRTSFSTFLLSPVYDRKKVCSTNRERRFYGWWNCRGRGGPVVVRCCTRFDWLATKVVDIVIRRLYIQERL